MNPVWRGRIVAGAVGFTVGVAALAVFERLYWGTFPGQSASRLAVGRDREDEESVDSDDPFARMRIMQKQMLRGFQGFGVGAGGPGGRSFVFRSGDEVNSREDSRYFYYDIAIDGLKRDRLKIRVEDGQLSLSGEIEKRAGDDDGTGMVFRSTFHRSIPIPPGGDASRVELEQAAGKIVVKIPKSA